MDCDCGTELIYKYKCEHGRHFRKVFVCPKCRKPYKKRINTNSYKRLGLSF